MGSIWRCYCETCRFSFHAQLGIGFLFPRVYQETVENMKAGTYDAQGKEFFEAFPDGAVSCEPIVVRCECCREFRQVPDLTMYVPNDSTAKNDIPYVYPTELKERYTEFEKFQHHCPKCGGQTTVVPEFTERRSSKSIPCPKCGMTIEIKLLGLWD